MKIKGLWVRNKLLTKTITKSCSFARHLPQGLCNECLLGFWEIVSAPSLIFELLQEEEQAWKPSPLEAGQLFPKEWKWEIQPWDLTPGQPAWPDTDLSCPQPHTGPLSGPLHPQSPSVCYRNDDLVIPVRIRDTSLNSLTSHIILFRFIA